MNLLVGCEDSGLSRWLMVNNLPVNVGDPIFPSGCEGNLGVALESPQGRRDLTRRSQGAMGDVLHELLGRNEQEEHGGSSRFYKITFL